MVETLELKTRSGLSFTVDAAGPADGIVVLLLLAIIALFFF